MPSDVISSRRSESVRVSFLRMGATGQRLQSGLAAWFDLLHKRTPEDRNALVMCAPEIVNEHSVAFARDAAGRPDKTIFVGRALTPAHASIAAQTVRQASLATPIAYTCEWGQGEVANCLVLPFGRPHQVVVVLFEATGRPAAARVYADEDEVTRARFMGTDALVDGVDAPLIDLLRAWEDRRRGGLLPGSQVPATDAALAGPHGRVHVIDVRCDSPDRFVFQRYDRRSRVAGAADYTGRCIADIPCPAYRSFVRDSYAMVKASGTVMVSHVASVHLDYVGTYRRLVYPLTDDGRQVTHLAVAVCESG